MRCLLAAAAIAAATLAIRPAEAATYSYDTGFTFSGQTSLNGGRGIAVNSADTRVFETVYGSTTGKILILDAANGAAKGSITAPTPTTTINDLALSPDGTLVYFLRYNGTDWEVDSAPTTDGAHTAAEVETVAIIAGDTPSGIASIALGSTVYLVVVTNASFKVYSSVDSAPFTLKSDLPLSYTTKARDVAALNNGTSVLFYVLTPGSLPQTAITVYAADGTVAPTVWSALPAGFVGYTLDSITSAGVVDGAPSLYLTADSADDFGTAVLTAFRYSSAGTYMNDGFGYGFSATDKLKDLQPLGTSPATLAPAAIVANHMYLGAALPDASLNPIDQTVRIVITPTTLVPGTITGAVNEAATPSNVPSGGAKIVVGGVDSPVTTTGSDGTYTLAPVNPGALTVGASKTGFVSTSTLLTLASGETKAAATMLLPRAVPVFTLGYAAPPPVTDGVIFAREYKDPSMPFYALGGFTPSASLQTAAYAMYDAQNIYIAVVGLEPSLSLNMYGHANQNILTLDDNVQLYLDPPHRHDVRGAANNLFQFAINIPAKIPGLDAAVPDRFQRRINANGTAGPDIAASAWFAKVTYFEGGWMVEARISVASLTPFSPPNANATWGLLVGRHRPSGHGDSLPPDYCTTDAPAARLTDSTTWTDVNFASPVAGVKGDINRNGVLDAADIVYVLRVAGGLLFGTTDPNDPAGDINPEIRSAVVAAADVWPDGAADGKITLEDAIRLARALTGLSPLH